MNMASGWKSKLSGEIKKKYFQELLTFLGAERKSKNLVLPPSELVFRALELVDYDAVKVVILGQDPYHGPGQALGLSFAVPNELKKKPPSLRNIFKELSSDLGVALEATSSDLSGWTAQGVFLLNTVLTVRAGEAFSHKEKGWEIFTDRIIALLNQREHPVIFVFWGAAAQKKRDLISNKRHFILESAHPSPLSSYRGFFGSKPFSKINQILTKELHGTSIDWTKTLA